jgi:hypothetical protein
MMSSQGGMMISLHGERIRSRGGTASIVRLSGILCMERG